MLVVERSFQRYLTRPFLPFESLKLHPVAVSRSKILAKRSTPLIYGRSFPPFSKIRGASEIGGEWGFDFWCSAQVKKPAKKPLKNMIFQVFWRFLQGVWRKMKNAGFLEEMWSSFKGFIQALWNVQITSQNFEDLYRYFEGNCLFSPKYLQFD